MGHSLPTWSCFCIYSYNLCLLAESAVSNIHNNYLFEETGEPCLRGLPGAWRQGLKRLMTCPSQSCSASTLAVQSVRCSKPSFSNTSLKSHAKAVVFIHQFCFFFLVTLTWDNCSYCLIFCTQQEDGIKNSSNTFKAVECLLLIAYFFFSNSLNDQHCWCIKTTYASSHVYICFTAKQTLIILHF